MSANFSISPPPRALFIIIYFNVYPPKGVRTRPHASKLCVLSRLGSETENAATYWTNCHPPPPPPLLSTYPTPRRPPRPSLPNNFLATSRAGPSPLLWYGWGNLRTLPGSTWVTCPTCYPVYQEITQGRDRKAQTNLRSPTGEVKTVTLLGNPITPLVRWPESRHNPARHNSK
jgi:hypothetical protein